MFNLFLGGISIFYIQHNYVIPQAMSHARGVGGRGHLGVFWVGMCRQELQIGTPF